MHTQWHAHAPKPHSGHLAGRLTVQQQQQNTFHPLAPTSTCVVAMALSIHLLFVRVLPQSLALPGCSSGNVTAHDAWLTADANVCSTRGLPESSGVVLAHPACQNASLPPCHR